MLRCRAGWWGEGCGRGVVQGRRGGRGVVRLLAEGTLEAAILKMQQRKMASQQPGEGRGRADSGGVGGGRGHPRQHHQRPPAAAQVDRWLTLYQDTPRYMAIESSECEHIVRFHA